MAEAAIYGTICGKGTKKPGPARRALNQGSFLCFRSKPLREAGGDSFGFYSVTRGLALSGRPRWGRHARSGMG